jgi:poly-gamma-glutamate capsule biosynthesis protein CapA/YwtB (metallophosphatase superfamily)
MRYNPILGMRTHVLNQNKLGYYLISLIFLFLFPACSQKQEVRLLPRKTLISSPSKNGIVIAAVGDVMMPASVQAAATREKRGYDFLFENITQDLRTADISFANLETPVDHKAVSSGYPKFNSHPALLTALRKAGVSVVSVANNHIMDAGNEGLRRTLGNIEAAGLVFTGAGRSQTEATEAKYLKAQDVNVAFLAYTYGTNERLPRKAARAPGVNILRPDSEADLGRAKAAVRRARTSADLVVVSLHWGNEYAPDPTPRQRQVASELVEAGADVILGHHPHVLQPIESYAASDGRRGLIVFSLGNFVTSQNAGITYANKDNRKALRGDGIILSITVVKDGGRARVEKAEFLPIWSLRTKSGSRTVCRPVSLAREISILAGKKTQTSSEKEILELLSYRQACIIRKLTRKLE